MARGREAKRWELYDLGKDIGEKENLVALMPEKAAELRTRLDTVLEAHHTAIPTAVPPKPKTRARKQ